MKKLISMALAAGMAVSLAACGGAASSSAPAADSAAASTTEAAADSDLAYICIQVREGSLQQMTATDAVI